MPADTQVYDGTANAQDGGKQSILGSDMTTPYSTEVIKAVWMNTAGTVSGFKYKDDTTGTARDWVVPAGQYIMGPFAEITAIPADAIAEFD